jgi:hypothetical protein
MTALVFLLIVGAVATVIARATEPPAGAARASQEFADAWNAGDFKAMYPLLSTPIAEDVFVDALGHTATPMRDARIERYAKLNDHQIITTYSALVPSLTSAVSGVVLANRFRYPEACSAAGARQATFQRLEDTLDLEQDSSGNWRIGLRGDTDFLQGGAKLLALSFDLAPSFLWQHITADANPSGDAYDRQVIDEATSAYNRDLGNGAGDLASTTAIQGYVRQIAASCTAAGG